MTTVQTFNASVNESALLKKLGLLFAGSDSFISEALQNARRAEATEIKVKFGDNTLQITDNGNGISDFSKLFVFCESGWADKIQTADNPYGMGVFSYFFAAEKVTFESRGHKVLVNSDEFLSGAPTEHESSDVTTGTVITFEGLKSDAERLQSALLPMVKGFPIPVFHWAESKDGSTEDVKHFAWKELPRPDALSGDFSLTDIGMVKTRLTTVNHLYLQGLPISSDSRVGNIVHLDSTQFQAVMPDRKMLFDSEIQTKRIGSAVFSLQLEQIKAAKLVMKPKDFVAQHFWFLKNHDASQIFDDVNYISSEMLDYVTPDRKDARAVFHESLTRETADSHVFVKNLPGMEDHPFAAMMHSVMEQEGWLALHSASETHWATEMAVDFESLSFEVKTSGQERTDTVNGLTLKVYDKVAVRVYNDDGFDVTVVMNSFILNPEKPEETCYFELENECEVLAPLGSLDTPECALCTYMYGEFHQSEDDAQRDEDAALWLATLQKLNGKADFCGNLEAVLRNSARIVSQSENEMAMVISTQDHRGTKCVSMDDEWFTKVAQNVGADPEKLKQAFLAATVD